MRNEGRRRGLGFGEGMYVKLIAEQNAMPRPYARKTVEDEPLMHSRAVLMAGEFGRWGHGW
jgi:hypothetical protein